MSEPNEERQVVSTESPPTPRQLELIVNLCFEGDSPRTRQDASDLIRRLLADPQTILRQDYRQRMQDGPNWLIWEKWMTHIGRKEYDRNNYLEWWKTVSELSIAAGIARPIVQPLPDELKGGLYHSPRDLTKEIQRVLSSGKVGSAPVELSVSSKEEVAAMKAFVKGYLEDLRTIDEDCQWMCARIREEGLKHEGFAQLFREASGGISTGQVDSKFASKLVSDQYKALRLHVRKVKEQLKSYLQEIVKNFGR